MLLIEPSRKTLLFCCCTFGNPLGIAVGAGCNALNKIQDPVRPALASLQNDSIPTVYDHKRDAFSSMSASAQIALKLALTIQGPAAQEATGTK